MTVRTVYRAVVVTLLTAYLVAGWTLMPFVDWMNMRGFQIGVGA